MVNYQIFSNVNLVRIFNSTCITLLEILNFLTENPIKFSIVFHLISSLGPVISSAPDNQSCTVGTRHKTLDPRHYKQCKQSTQEMLCRSGHNLASIRAAAEHQTGNHGRLCLHSLLWLTAPPWRNYRNQQMNGPPAYLLFCTHFLASVRFQTQFRGLHSGGYHAAWPYYYFRRIATAVSRPHFPSWWSRPRNYLLMGRPGFEPHFIIRGPALPFMTS